MKAISIIRLLIVFSVTFSLASLTGLTSGNLHLPTLKVVHANVQACQTHGSGGACSEFWYPAGAEMNTELINIFTDETAELANLQSPTPTIDFTDSPLPPALIGPITANPNFLVTAPVGQVGYYEIQFHLANNFWGCAFNFGNSVCGKEIRQGIAHMIDKTSFMTNQPAIAGISTSIDNPVPTTSSGGLLTPNPCGYDAGFLQGVNGVSPCIVGAPGGTSYHLAASAGANGIPWLQAPGSPDLNAAAQHFVNAGIAAGFAPANSILVGVVPAAAANPAAFFIRNDDPARLDLGNSLAEEICYLFTGVYTVPCADLSLARGPATAFPGFITSKTAVNLNWGMYTASYSYVPFFDNSLYYSYNSRFVSGIPAIQQPAGPCSPQSVPTASAADYTYLCSSTYDGLSTQMESAPCLVATGDPATGAGSNLPTPPGNGLCPGTTQLSAISAGIQAEAYFGTNAFTLPVFEKNVQFAYLNNGWLRAVNSAGTGLINRFTSLNAWNPAPVQAGTIRQGFSQTTKSVNPYIASTPSDIYIEGSVYDSLYAANPLSPGQVFNWMTLSTHQFSNSSLAYMPPAHTLTTYDFILPNIVYFHDVRRVTVYDVAFSYLSMVATGAFLGTGATSMTGITILGPNQFDIGVSSLGPFVLPNLASIPIVPGRYWTNSGSSAWDSAIAACGGGAGCGTSQYTLSGATVNCALNCGVFSAGLMTVNPANVAATFDPIVSNSFVGSGPWQCGTVTSSGSGVCSSSGNQNPPVGGGYTLTRFGTGFAPASSVSQIYFRSPGNLAVFIWACLGALIVTISCYTSVLACYGLPVNPLSSCYHYQQGIGASPTGIIGIALLSYFNIHFNVDWVYPYDWNSGQFVGIAGIPPILYEGSVTLNPASIVGCPGGYDC